MLLLWCYTRDNVIVIYSFVLLLALRVEIEIGICRASVWSTIARGTKE